MAAIGAHMLLYTPEPEALRSVLRDVFGFTHVGIDIPGEPVDDGYGVTVMMNLPGGCQVQLYEPHHPLAIETAGPPR